jgi:hypothetical protein
LSFPSNKIKSGGAKQDLWTQAYCSVLLKMMLSIIIDVLLFILSVLFHASLISETNVNLTV